MLHGIKKVWKALGPGLITGVSDDDPSGLTAYTIVGARFGNALLWTLLFLLPLMIAVQEMSARIGALSGCGLAGNIKRHYPKAILLVTATAIIAANIFNIGADIAGMAGALHVVIPMAPENVLAIALSGIVLSMTVLLSYRHIVTAFKWIALSLLGYVITFFMVHNEGWSILQRLVIPTFHLDREFFLMFFAVLGTTISPYLYFWQASEEAEEVRQGNPRIRACRFRAISDRKLDTIRLDTRFGMFFSNFIAFFVMALAAATLFTAGAHNIETMRDAATALRPLAGDYAYILFALGVVSSGILAIPVLAGSAAYVLAEIFGWQRSLDKPFSRAREFYIVIIVSTVVGLLIPILGFSPVKALFYTAILHALIAPLLIALIIHMANNPAIVGDQVSNPKVNALGYLTLALMVGSGIAVAWPYFLA